MSIEGTEATRVPRGTRILADRSTGRLLRWWAGDKESLRATLYPELAEKLKGLGRRGEVLAGIWAGKGTKEIAVEMGISPKTVEYHRARLYQVFGVNDPVSLCRRAIAVGLINPKAEIRRMPEAMPHACHSESESESDKRQV
jgi:DNA-binding CsgD family transcriptional regulator